MAPKSKIAQELKAFEIPNTEQYREMLATDKGLQQIHNKVTEWQEQMAEGGYRLSDGLMIGNRSLGEIVEDLGIEQEELKNKALLRVAVIFMDGLNKTHNKDGQLCPPCHSGVA